ncbi:RING-type E3 ubiquitin transferase [Ranunculus cassubicifolius]
MDGDWEKSASSRGLNSCVISEESVANRVVSRIDDGCVMGKSDVSLREWLDRSERSVDGIECLHIFRQIVDMVNLGHSQGVVVHNVRPSCFVMSSVNRVSFIESASCSSSGSASCDDALNSQGVDVQCSSSHSLLGLQQQSRTDSEEWSSERNPKDAYVRMSDVSCLQSTSVLPTCLSSIEESEERQSGDSDNSEKDGIGMEKQFPLKQVMILEMSWYTSPEEANEDPGSFSSDIYRLGVLLFELFCTFSSMGEKLRTMSNLRHRVLPPQLLLKWPKEAIFCLWLLHPDSNTRPKMGEVLQSEFLNGPRDSLEEREAAIKLKEEIEEHELLLEFLLMMQLRKQEAAKKLQKIVTFLSSDIGEVTKQLSMIKEKEGSLSEPDEDDVSVSEKVENQPLHLVGIGLGLRKRSRQDLLVNDMLNLNEHPVEVNEEEPHSGSQGSVLSKNSRLMKNFKKIEAAYFSTRCEPTQKLLNKSSQISSNFRRSVVMTEGSTVDEFTLKKVQTGNRKGEWINPFLEGLCKYLSFSKLQVKADLKQGDLLSSSNLVCCLSFDRDKEFFATAGVNRKIKIFECDMILNGDRDIHYPVVEMASTSTLSGICWNGYIKNQIASSDFKGVVQVWDVTRSQVFMEMREHEKRVWSVDFSLADPTNLASGSDDGAVKLWNINQSGSVATIKTKANVCCVQYPPNSARLLAIGSADHKVYCYDLRSTKTPLYTLKGHAKTVSYVKFLDPTTLVSASTDSSIKLWDLSMCSSRVIDTPIQTFTGHTNLKNFVGLSVSDGYIATGSETNEVFIYHKAFPMPVMSYEFSNTDPLSGHELDDPSQYVSAVCWRGQTSTLVAANSTGNIKVLEMV